ncbi:MAG: hypothetical protein AMXMBFR84_00130 [Candidatus Hydrogenedentota bacterium]
MSADIDAVRAVCSGDRDRFEELVVRYQRLVYGIAWSRLGDPDLCDEATQETFLKGYCQIRSLRDPGRFGSWIGSIARNVSTSLGRKQGRIRRDKARWAIMHAGAESDVSDAVRDVSVDELLQDTMASMPDVLREALVLFYLEGKSIREAARILGIKETTMRTRLHRARGVIRGRMERRLDEALGDLRPRANFPGQVMAAIPLEPATLGILGSGTSILTSAAGKALACAAFFLVPVSGLLAGLWTGWWLHKREAGNFVPGRAGQLRAKAHEDSLRWRTLCAVWFMFLFFAGSWWFGFARAVLVLSVLCGVFVLASARRLVIDRTYYRRVQVISITFYFAAIVCMGLFGQAGSALFVLWPGLVMLQFYAERHGIVRHDGNLFLRHAAGLLAVEGCPTSRAMTAKELWAFARFCGDRQIAADWTWRRDGLELWLPLPQEGIGVPLRWHWLTSSVLFSYDGTRHARLSESDARWLMNAGGVDEGAIEQSEQDVEKACALAMDWFLRGNCTEAERALGTVAMDEVFQVSPTKSRTFRTRFAVAFAAAIVYAVMVILGPP